jgi:ribonucleoside-triphosphate reductase
METSSLFKTAASEFVYVRTYSRWLDEKGRRETWPETVERYVNFIMTERANQKIPAKVFKKIREKMLAFEVMPSMRAVHAAGDAARLDNTTMFNCSFQCVDSPLAFSEALYILMCGAGYGFSVEKRHIEKLPIVPCLSSVGGTFVIEDSKKGWADSVKFLLQNLYNGSDLAMDYSKIRPMGARLKTMGGRASGPAPLIKLHEFVRQIFAKAQGRKLNSLECLDIMNMIAEVVVVGGVRRSSQISLSDLNDTDMRGAKTGNYPLYRAMSNNSAVYVSKPDAIGFMNEWAALAASGTGERGLFNLESARKMAPKRRNGSLIEGTNPCGEIQLRNREFCNLSEVVIRADDDLDSLLEKVETAAWLGAIQSTFTHFPYLSPEWKKNCDEERLLGVSLTGQMDAPHLLTPEALQALRSRAIKVAKKAAGILNINVPTAITCCKPSGTVSQVVDSASGVHTRYAKYYLRRYRIWSNDPLFRLLKDQGFPLSPENGQRKSDWEKAKKADLAGESNIVLRLCSIYTRGQEWSEDKPITWVATFPMKAPEGAITRNDLNALDQLNHYKKLQKNWCEHNASITVYVKDEEWLEVGSWVHKNWDIVNGISFLPYDGGKYEQTPYEEITKDQYEDFAKNVPVIDYSRLSTYEHDDQTTGSKEVACSGGACNI